MSLMVPQLSLHLHWQPQAWEAPAPRKTGTQQTPKDTRGLGRGSLTVLRLVGEPAVLGVLVDVVGVALGTLLGPEVLIGPRALLAVAYLVLELGP